MIRAALFTVGLDENIGTLSGSFVMNRFRDGVEDLLVEAFVSKATMKTFDKAILPQLMTPDDVLAEWLG